MVQITYAQEKSNCKLSEINQLRRSSDLESDMGNQEGHFQESPPLSPAEDAKEIVEINEKSVENAEKISCNNFIGPKLEYSVEYLLALRDKPLSQVKPACVDNQLFWIDSKPYVFKKKYERRIGSGRLGQDQRLQMNNFRPPNPFREKTGREFCDTMFVNGSDTKPSYFNPVNKDHRRLMEERSEDAEPEWFNTGPISRLDTIELHGFHDDESYRQGRTSSIGTKTSLDNKENHEKYGQNFSFDEFLGTDGSIDRFLPATGSHGPRHVQQGSRFKRYFKQRDHIMDRNGPHNANYIQAQKHKYDSNNNTSNALLDLLHNSAGSNPEMAHQHMTYKNLSQMPVASELESIWRQNSTGNQSQQVHDYQKMMQQMDYNKSYLAGKSLVEILGVLAQSQIRQQQMNPLCGQQWADNRASGINQIQFARAIERQLQVQAQNSGHINPIGPNNMTPQYWEKIYQQQQAYYEQYERNLANRHVKANFPGRQRRVSFQDKTKLESFFTPEVVAQASAGQFPVIDAEKAIKVEEFERKIKEAAAACKSNDK